MCGRWTNGILPYDVLQRNGVRYLIVSIGLDCIVLNPIRADGKIDFDADSEYIRRTEFGWQSEGYEFVGFFDHRLERLYKKNEVIEGR